MSSNSAKKNAEALRLLYEKEKAKNKKTADLNWKANNPNRAKVFYSANQYKNKGNNKKYSNYMGGKKKSIRKHKGINQTTGRLKKGYKYSGKKLKSGLPQIIHQ